MNIKKLRLALVALLLILAAGFTAVNVWLAGNISNAPAPSAELAAEEKPNTQQSVPPVKIGGNFGLMDQSGSMVFENQFRDKYMLVFFGFTSCPDICSVAMLTITNVLTKLGDEAKQIAPIFITIDPERDNPARLSEFLANFHPSFVGLTGAKPDIEQVISMYKVYAAKQSESADGSYNVDHSGFIYLMDKRGEYLKHFPNDISEEQMLSEIKGYLK